MAVHGPKKSFVLNNPEEMRAFYDKWAEDYDNEMLTTHNYQGHKCLADLVQKYAKPTDLIISTGAGTGLDAEELKKRGFHNQHGHDGSIEMLNKAKAKNLFKEYIHELLLENTQSSIETGKYDVMANVACFVPKAMNENHVDDLIRIIKVGGLSIIGTREMFMTRCDKPGYLYPFELEKKLQSLVASGKLELLERKRQEEYCYAGETPGLFLVHRKLK